MVSPPCPRAAKLFIVTSTLLVGGTEYHLARVLPGLVRRGWDVTLFALSGDGPLRPSLERGGVTVHFALHSRLLARGSFVPRVLRLALGSLGMFRLLRVIRPAIAQFFLPEAYLVGAFCAIAAGVPRMIMSRRSSNLYQRRHYGVACVERWLHRRMSRITGNSLAVLRELEREGVPRSRLQLIYNGIELPPLLAPAERERIRASLSLRSDTLVLITLANLLPYKGHRDLLDALALAAGALPSDWRLVCAGRDDGCGAALHRHAEKLGIQAHLLWLGERHDIPDLLGAADIGLLASHEEGFSNAVLEGMGSGLPMIVTDVGGNAEAVLDGITGYVVPKQQPELLAAAIARLGTDAELRSRLGSSGRQRIAEHFSLAACISGYEALYGSLGAKPWDRQELCQPT